MRRPPRVGSIVLYRFADGSDVPAIVTALRYSDVVNVTLVRPGAKELEPIDDVAHHPAQPGCWHELEGGGDGGFDIGTRPLGLAGG